MTRFLLYFILALFFGCSSTIKKEEGTPKIEKQVEKFQSFVFDNENILTETQILKFDSLFRKHEKKTTNEIVLVTTQDYGQDENILHFSVNFANRLGVGKAGKNNGVVIVMNSAKREVRISTGYGTENVLTDAIAQKIVDSIMVPRFKEGKLYEGLFAGSKAVVDFLERPENVVK